MRALATLTNQSVAWFAGYTELPGVPHFVIMGIIREMESRQEPGRALTLHAVIAACAVA